MASTSKRDDFGLAIETSGEMGSVALGQGARILEARSFPAALRHATDLLPTVDILCRSHGASPDRIGRVFISLGPGSFTGLRIGLTAARMLAFARGAKLVGVPSLEVVAQNALEADPVPSRVAVIVDAKRGRVFGAVFALQGGKFVGVQGPAEVEPLPFLAAQGSECAVLGEGIAQHHTAVEASGLRILPEALRRPRAGAVYARGTDRAARGRFDDPRMLVPLYVRPPEAEEKWAQRHT